MNTKQYPSLIIAGIRGGSGKTTITLGVIGALSKTIKVSPFKKGPDYIDAGWMSKSAGYPCYNLDHYLIGESGVINSFITNFKGDIAIIEGNRGLYDGMDLQGSYSTAQLAKLLDVPIILVIDCSKITRTAAALVLGCQKLDEAIKIRGVILNQISNLRHEKIIRESIQHYCNIPVIGAMPRMNEREMTERHMGLVPIYEHTNTDKVITHLTNMAVQNIDISALQDIAIKNAPNHYISETCITKTKKHIYNLKIGVIMDDAFQFYYPDNIDVLKYEGAEVVYINAMFDKILPEIHGLYIGGGFPETNAIKLTENKSFKDSLKNAIQKGLPVYAECGGLMYLGKKIIVDGNSYDMTGIYDIVFEMNKKPVAHGYTEVLVNKKNPFYPIGTILKGHEFHYSSVNGAFSNLSYSFSMIRGKGIIEKQDGVLYKNCLATYTHIHALGTNEWAKGMIKAAMEYRNEY